MGKKKKKTGRSSRVGLFARTLFLLAVCGIAAFVVLAVRLYDVQIVNHNYFHARALSTQLSQSTITASRGTIFDASGNVMAISAPVENVFISPLEMARENQDVRLIADGLSSILGVDREVILQRASRTNSQYQIIKTQVEAEQAQQVRDFIREHRLRGIHFEPNFRRHFPNNSLAGQIVGFVGTEHTGLNGLELRYEDYLTGVSGRRVRLTSARGNDMSFVGFDDFFDAQDGHDITLTIDLSVQYFLEKHLVAAIEQYRVRGGATAIAMNARTGAIMAMASYPNFDPNYFTQVSQREQMRLDEIEDEEEFANALREAQFRMWQNRALTDTYEPGSVFKVVSLAMAMEENLASLDTVFNCHGSMNVLGRVDRSRNPLPFRCMVRTGHGTLTLCQAMQRSCNIVTADLAVRLGARTFYDYIEAFGLFGRTDLGSLQEAQSHWWNENVFFNRHNHSQLVAASIGQTFAITPLQMITAATATINGGYLMQPFLVHQIHDSEGNLIRENEPEVIRQVISERTSADMRTMLENTVLHGTGRNAQVQGFRVGGKTGTSEDVVQLALTYEGARGDVTVSFVGFAPVEDPEIVILVILEAPCRATGLSATGGGMAAPVVGSMLADILPISLGITPQYTEEQLQDLSVYVPRVAERPLFEATNALRNLRLDHEVIGSGERVIAQLPQPNARVSSGTTVRLFTDSEVPDHEVTVPSLSGMTFEGARRTLANRGLFIRTTGVPPSAARAEVSVQAVPEGQQVAYGSVIEVTLIDMAIADMLH